MNQIEAKKQKIEYFSYIIGIFAFMLLGALIGNNGVTYMAVILEGVSLFVLLVNGCCAEVMGRLLRSRRKKGMYKEAEKLQKAVLLVQGIAAVVLMLVYFLLTDVLASLVFKMPYLAVAMKLLTPVILLHVWQNFVLGYFQGQGSHMPGVVCCIFRQLLFLLFGLLFTGKLTAYGAKVSALLNNADYEGMYGAVGMCLAILLSEILLSLFLLVVYIGSDRKKEKKRAEDGLQKVENLKDRIRLIMLVSLPEAAKDILRKLPFGLAVLLMIRTGEDVSGAAESYGLFFRAFVCVCAVIVLLICMQMLNVYCYVNAGAKKKDNRMVREGIYAGMHYSWAAGLFVAVSLAVLFPQISKLLVKEEADLVQAYYTYGAALVGLVLVCIFLWGILHLFGAKAVKYLVLVLGNAAFAGGYLLIQGKQEDKLKALCLAALVGCVLAVLLSFGYILKKYGLLPDMIRTVLIPGAGAGAMGLVMMLVQKLLGPHLGNLMCLILCLILGLIVYLAVLLLTKSVRETEVECLYGAAGRKLLGPFIR